MLADNIGAHESGGMTERGENCDHLRGASGEVGCFQTMPSTWKSWARTILKYDARPTYENQRYVVSRILEAWDKEGLTDTQKLWRYNGTDRKGNCHAGTNAKGVKYDSCGYALAVLSRR